MGFDIVSVFNPPEDLRESENESTELKDSTELMNGTISKSRYEQYLYEMSACNNEFDHLDADNNLANFVEELGYTELANLYRKCPKWFS